uniref:Leiomodin-1 n=1 Tax=Neogobius melanostomus TaxID=47308 RepID=A0A8C6SYN9_9GOBI
MSRRKVKGLTRTGRQVSEDPDLDNLLSTLSPEEVEELQIDLSKVPDLNPDDGALLAQGEGQPSSQTSKGDRRKEADPRGRLGHREQLQEVRVESSANKSDDQNSKGPEGLRDERSRLSGRYRPQESRDSEMNEKESLGDHRLRRDRESTGSKAKDMISKLQEKKDDKEKDRKDDFRKRDDSKTKDLISKLKEKNEKDVGRERERRSENFRTQGLVSKMLEKQNKAQESQESKVEEQKAKADEKKVEEKKSEDLKEKAKFDGAKPSKTDEKIVNCIVKDSPKSKTKEEEDEDSSMFDELMEQVRSNDPSLTELNVNNSEVIKTKTLIEFTEALKNNTHIKTFALANCRADDHVAYAISGMLRSNKTITSLNVDSNLLTGKGILSLIQALQYNSTLTELRFQNQRHVCGGKTEMEMVKILKENTTLLKLGYHFELAGPRMTTTNILSRNMDRQRQKRLQEQKQALANGEKKETLNSFTKPSPIPSPMPSPKLTPKRGTVGGLTPPPPPPPPGGAPPPPPPPMLDIDSLKNSLTPVSQRKLDGKGPGGSKNSRDQLLASIRTSNKTQLKKVPVPKWLQ